MSSSRASAIARKRNEDFQRFQSRRLQAHNSVSCGIGSGNSQTDVIEEPPPPPSSYSSIPSIGRLQRPPRPASSSLPSAAAEVEEDESRDITLHPTISSQRIDDRARRRSTNTTAAAAIARKQADLNELDAATANSSSSRRRRTETSVSFDPSVISNNQGPRTPTRQSSRTSQGGIGSPDTTSSSYYASTISSLTTDSFIERKRQAMNWPSIVPEHEEGKEDPDIEENPFRLGRSNNDEGHNQYPVPTAPAVVSSSSTMMDDIHHIPVIHVEATPVFEDEHGDDDDYNSNNSQQEIRRKKNPFKDWRVLVFVMIAVSSIVGLSVGLVMKNNTNGGVVVPISLDGNDSPKNDNEEKPVASSKVAFSFSMELSTSDINAINKDTLVDITTAHMAETMKDTLDSFEDIELNVILQVGGSGQRGRELIEDVNFDNEYSEQRQYLSIEHGEGRRINTAIAMFEAVLTLKEGSSIPIDKTVFVENVLSTSFSDDETKVFVQSLGNAGLDVTDLSPPTLLAVVEDENPPTKMPTLFPTKSPTASPSMTPSVYPSILPSVMPSLVPTNSPSKIPTKNPTIPSPGSPTKSPTASPSKTPTVNSPTLPTSSSSSPTITMSSFPSVFPSLAPSPKPSVMPSLIPTSKHSSLPSLNPTFRPTISSSFSPSAKLSDLPSRIPTSKPTSSPIHELQTTSRNKFSRSGAMFDVKSLDSSVTIVSMDILLDVSKSDIGGNGVEVEVWTRDGGSYKSYEQDAAAWTWRNDNKPYIISSDTFENISGANLVSIERTSFDPIFIPAGQTMGFYVTLRLNNGMVVGGSETVDEDNYLRITTGTSNKYRFQAGVNTQRSWNGALKYVLS